MFTPSSPSEVTRLNRGAEIVGEGDLLKEALDSPHLQKKSSVDSDNHKLTPSRTKNASLADLSSSSADRMSSSSKPSLGLSSVSSVSAPLCEIANQSEELFLRRDRTVPSGEEQASAVAKKGISELEADANAMPALIKLQQMPKRILRE